MEFLRILIPARQRLQNVFYTTLDAFEKFTRYTQDPVCLPSALIAHFYAFIARILCICRFVGVTMSARRWTVWNLSGRRVSPFKVRQRSATGLRRRPPPGRRKSMRLILLIRLVCLDSAGSGSLVVTKSFTQDMSTLPSR